MERRAEAVAAADEVVAPSSALVVGLPDAVRDRDALSDGALHGTRQLRDHVKRLARCGRAGRVAAGPPDKGRAAVVAPALEEHVRVARELAGGGARHGAGGLAVRLAASRLIVAGSRRGGSGGSGGRAGGRARQRQVTFIRFPRAGDGRGALRRARGNEEPAGRRQRSWARWMRLVHAVVVLGHVTLRST